MKCKKQGNRRNIFTDLIKGTNSSPVADSQSHFRFQYSLSFRKIKLEN